jgi:hypothetical protein
MTADSNIEPDLDKLLSEKTKMRADEPLTFLEAFFAGLYGGVLGLLGLIVIWADTSRFKKEGFLLKSKKTWRIYWIAYGIRMLLIVSIFIIFDYFRK